MTAWVAYTDALAVSVDYPQSSGANYPDNRQIWFDLDHVSCGGPGGSQWWRDAGPKGMAANLLERRAFCLHGVAAIVFTGRTLIIRINVAFSWFTGAVVLIDGQVPSTMGLLTARDTLSCDAATYLLTNDAFIDVMVADGLADTAHTCTITVNSPDPAKFFSLAGYKVGVFATQPLARGSGWIVPLAALLPQNKAVITVTNRSNATVIAPVLNFPASLVNGSGVLLAPLSAASIAPSATMTQELMPIFTGQEISATFPFAMTLAAEYPDPAGDQVHTLGFTAAVGNVALAVAGTWFQDNLAPGGLARLYTTDQAATISVTFDGDALTVTVQQALSWGVIGVYASNNITLLGTVTCNVDSPLLGSTTLTGFGPGSHPVILRKRDNDGAFIVFVSVSWSVTQNYSLISEVITLNYAAHQPYAMLAQSVHVLPEMSGMFDVTYAPPVVGALDYSGTPVRQNTDLAYTEVLERFPTYCVFYKAGLVDLLGQYDVLIVDPFAVHLADVQLWQARGISVYGYISSGEEFGFYSNRYDFASALAPNSGAGPGGRAEYYMYTRHPGTGPPDQDGVWAAYYINPDPAYGWPARVNDYYAPLVLSAPQVIVDEVVTLSSAVITAGTVKVFDTAHTPIDEDQPMVLKTMDGLTTYLIYRDFTFDTKTGAYVMNNAVSPAVSVGQQLKFSYTRKGLSCDGVFFDTVDTPDVYASGDFGYVYVPGYAAEFAAFINGFADAYPTARIISNRGFTILDDIIARCDGVMFETWLTTPTDLANLNTTDYVVITDPVAIAYNNGVNDQLSRLRATHVFDVYSLNYCHNDSRGDDLRLYCREQDAAYGYLSWQSTITLDTPQPNTIAGTTPGIPLPVSSTSFLRYLMKAL
jgi:hypothetical protein